MMFLVFVLFILAFLACIGVLVGLIKPSTFRNKKTDAIPSRLKVLGVGLAVFFTSIIVAVIIAPDDMKAPQPNTPTATSPTTVEPVKNTEQAAKENTEKLTQVAVKTSEDLPKFIEYHKQLVALSNPIDNAQEELKKVFASKKLDQFKIYEAASNLHAVAQNCAMHTPKPPEFDDSTIQDKVKEVREDFSTYCLLRQSASDKMRKAVDGGEVKPSDVASIKDTNGGADAAMMSYVAKVFSAYELLKVDSKKVDFKNGGVKP